jgi:hypothetical protein
MPRSRRHHYLPIFYLKGFIDPDHSPFLWIYGKENDDIIKSNVVNAAVRKDYYSFVSPEGSMDPDTVETMLSTVESYAAPVFRKIIERRDLNDEERSHFALFLALLYVRVPSFRENLEKSMGDFMKKLNFFMASHKEGFEASIKRVERDTGKEIGMPIEELRKFVLEGEYDITVIPEMSLAMGIELVPKFTEIFFHMQWIFFTAPEDYKFVTSDNPLSVYDPTYDPRSFWGIGLLNKNIEIVFPISGDIACLGIWKENKRYPGLKEGFQKGNNRIVKALDKRIVRTSFKYVFASYRSRILHAFVNKHIGKDRLVMEIS